MSGYLRDLDTVEGKTVEKVVWEPSGAGADRDARSIQIIFTDGTSVDLYASSYIIPEEPSITCVVNV